MGIILLCQRHFFTKMHLQPERLYFSICVLRLALSMVIVVTEKNTKNHYFIQVEILFMVVVYSNTVTF